MRDPTCDLQAEQSQKTVSELCENMVSYKLTFALIERQTINYV